MIIINICFWYVLGNQNGALKRLIFSWWFFGSTLISGTRQYVSDISHSFAKFSFPNAISHPAMHGLKTWQVGIPPVVVGPQTLGIEGLHTNSH